MGIHGECNKFVWFFLYSFLMLPKLMFNTFRTFVDF